MESTGARLKKIRLEKGVSLEEVRKKTKLHLNILKAIEEDSLVDFSPVYIKGFLKIYCQFLGVDPKGYIPDYKEPQVKVEYVSDFREKPLPLLKKTSLLKLPSLKTIRIKTKTIYIFILMLVFIVGLFNLGKITSLKHNLLSKRTEAATASGSSIKNKAEITKAGESSSLKIIRLDIHAKENCFINVKTDGRVMFQNILRKGKSETWQAINKIEVSLNNAGAVELEVNGKRISSLGRRGQAIKNILITKEGLSIRR
jgi:cytoskeletal protein RodZ